jgi:hypothetical protein
MSAGKGSADTRTPNRAAREAAWERIWGKAPEARIRNTGEGRRDTGYGIQDAGEESFRVSEGGADGVSEDRKEEKKDGDFSQRHRGTE